ncbi:hypothetical protein LIER_02581 [Lithospermum erythrorhizon]|uniref:Uncharacterized protein n=1 Tax=Lithospermum erythrorhizon TaxID=34254 RepID=A0AAV3NQE1_LITER
MSTSESKPIKKEIEDDDDDKPIGSRNRNVPIPKNAKLKKELNKPKKEDSDDDFDNKPINTKSSTKPNKVPVKKNDKEDVKKKKGGKEAEVATVKKEKKVYDLPGQKRDPPEERDSLRIFYESLYEQVPTSEMAAVWMMESGLLPRDKAAKVFERKQKKAQQQKLGSPMKSVVTVKKGDSVTVKKKTSTPVSKLKKETPQTKKTPPTKVASQQSNKRKIQESSSSEESSESDSDNEVIAAPKNRKKQRLD